MNALPQPTQNNKDRRNQYLIGGSLLGGLGLKSLSQTLSPSILGKFKDTEVTDIAKNQHLSVDPSFDNSFRVLKEYAGTGSELMNTPVFGLEPKNYNQRIKIFTFHFRRE